MTAAYALQAIEECCLGTIGSVRTVTAGAVLRDAYGKIDTFTLAERVRVKPRVEVELMSELHTGIVAPKTASIGVLELGIMIRLALTTETEVDADQRLATRMAALDLWRSIREALTWGGNLLFTQAAVATGVVSGVLASCGRARVVEEDWKNRILRIEVPARVLVKQDQVTS